MYLEIFDEVVDIMQHDYAGYIDKKGWDDPEKYRNIIRGLEKDNGLTADQFVEIVQDYLLDFKDPHMGFNLIKSEQQKEYSNGFRVRRFEDKLYVTKVGKEERFLLGDAIVSLDNIPVLDLVQLHKRELMEKKAEREDWRKVISKYRVAEVMDKKGTSRLVELKRYEKEEYRPIHTISRIDANTLCMTLTDFFDVDTITKLVEEHKNELTQTDNLIIDVRVNYGGSTFAYHSLVNYLFPSQPMMINYKDYAMKFNCTTRNAESTIRSLSETIKQIKDEKTRNNLVLFKQAWEEHIGKGFVAFDSNDDEVEVYGDEYPRNIIVLSDNYCGSAGDIFVYFCKKSPKVSVIGRPTMGVNDYSNLTEITWGNQFKFGYPTSRLDQLDKRDPFAEPGIKPDVYMPWTPEHIEKDVDMEEALRILHSKATV
ncbi:Peptidase family S41 [Oceanobacillus limi]|uniref:Peptidase family S41 n=1 Tax=Oceanobacillus limi TaxID=930131 RepID=A0A1I0B4X7_9BACI|nr:S41 family peptidase [Oceanobacillus limi]SET01783.1 Peptidase family S41 [Oceanobacillus limi]